MTQILVETADYGKQTNKQLGWCLNNVLPPFNLLISFVQDILRGPSIVHLKEDPPFCIKFCEDAIMKRTERVLRNSLLHMTFSAQQLPIL